jgi:4-aminobutyrate aminotransferase-like enzyme
VDGAAHARGVLRHFGIAATAIGALPGELDRNYRVESDQGTFVLKISQPDADIDELSLGHALMQHLQLHPGRLTTPRAVEALNGMELLEVSGGTARLLTWVPGAPYLGQILTTEQAFELGAGLGDLVTRLASLHHPAGGRYHPWNALNALDTVAAHRYHVTDPHRRHVIEQAFSYVAGLEGHWDELPQQLIHGDANDLNVLLTDGHVTGLIDFSDTVHSVRVAELAVGCTYAMLDAIDPIGVGSSLVRGWRSTADLTDPEANALLPLVVSRLAVSVTVSAGRRDEGNPHNLVSERAGWDLLERIMAGDRDAMAAELATGTPPLMDQRAELTARRDAHLGSALSLGYDEPLHIVRGVGAHLYDARAVDYLDCVNNICHVGHSHPAVIEAAARQWTTLNTNTRYLHPRVLDYAERLAAMCPDGLEVVYVVNSGSEANELALRMARAATGSHDVVVFADGYHGNTTAMVDISGYKFDGPGGAGKPDWVHVVDTPGPGASAGWAEHVAARVPADGVAALFAEAIIGCGGQIVPEPGVLATLYDAVRQAGGVVVADEVQTGFGRVGSHWWAFELHDVVPDIVTMGKPAGNGHPLGAVVTTRAIADAFDNGMEYFNSFGGNPVSAAVGLAVLDVIEDEGLRENAAEVGGYLMSQLRAIEDDRIIDVRGAGLFLGIELADAAVTKSVVEHAKTVSRVLLSIDGPHHNVIKIKPPLVFSHEDADRLVAALRQALTANHTATDVGWTDQATIQMIADEPW